ncbi:hypothetical protein H9P43_009732 [Blastocladiella emersonii ATCC 22665]|nr:hypothetical protein H9P43_009732 [Blastocladiella emersonii ATCC 22665]
MKFASTIGCALVAALLACTASRLGGIGVDARPTAHLAKRQGGGGGALPPPPAGLAPFPSDTRSQTVWELLAGNPSFSNLTSIARNHTAGAVTVLNSTDNIVTVFAPYDEAWAPLVAQPLFQFANGTAQFDRLWLQLVGYHAHNGSAVNASAVPPLGAGNLTLSTLAPLNVTLQRATTRPTSGVGVGSGTGRATSPLFARVQQSSPGGDGNGSEQVYVNDAQVIYADVPASNGVIHVIDRVLNPLFDLVPPVATRTRTVTATATSGVPTLTVPSPTATIPTPTAPSSILVPTVVPSPVPT